MIGLDLLICVRTDDWDRFINHRDVGMKGSGTASPSRRKVYFPLRCQPPRYGLPGCRVYIASKGRIQGWMRLLSMSVDRNFQPGDNIRFLAPWQEKNINPKYKRRRYRQYVTQRRQLGIRLIKPTPLVQLVLDGHFHACTPWKIGYDVHVRVAPFRGIRYATFPRSQLVDYPATNTVEYFEIQATITVYTFSTDSRGLPLVRRKSGTEGVPIRKLTELQRELAGWVGNRYVPASLITRQGTLIVKIRKESINEWPPKLERTHRAAIWDYTHLSRRTCVYIKRAPDWADKLLASGYDPDTDTVSYRDHDGHYRSRIPEPDGSGGWR